MFVDPANIQEIAVMADEVGADILQGVLRYPSDTGGWQLGDLDDFLEEEGRLAEAEAVATKRVLAFQIAKLMEEQHLSKAEMARRMSTSRAAVDRLLDFDTESATLATLEKAAAALGRRLHVALV